MQILVDMLGWIGTVLYLVAYALVSLKKEELDSVLYQGINILAGILLIINTYYWHAYPSVGLNAAWLGIGVLTLGRKYLVRKSHTA
jgi:hypothetical protein